jgi:hydrogenase nickel incorporation protein HypA/HybF
MHESSLGKQVLEAVLQKARESGGGKIVKVVGWVAETEHLDPSAIAFHFSAHARGTAAEEAKLEMDLRWVEARCDGCGAQYKPDHHLLLCPDCGSTEAELLGETGVAVTSIEVARP